MPLRLPLPLLLVALGATAGVACDDGSGDDPLAEFIGALPTRDTLALDVPGEGPVDTTNAPLDVIEAPLLGEPSALKLLTGTTRRFLLMLIDNVSEGIEHMTEGKPILQTRDRVMWRKSFVGHERALIMQRSGGHFDVVSWLRPLDASGAPSGPWRFLLSGRITLGRGGDGRGAVWVDLDNDRRERSHGKMTVLWSRMGHERQLEILIFDGTPDDGEVGRLTRGFHYKEGPDGGLFAFDAGELDVHLSPQKPGLERVRVFTRWNAARAMRADYSAVGPEVRADGFRVLIGGECWHAPEGIVTYEARIGLPFGERPPVPLFERGDRATCAFPEEEAPIIAPPGDAPVEPPRPIELDDP